MRELRGPDLTLVLLYGTIVPTPWFWHATVNQTNARNASSELAAMFPVFQRGAEALLPFSRIHARLCRSSCFSRTCEQWICSSDSTITTFISIRSHLIFKAACFYDKGSRWFYYMKVFTPQRQYYSTHPFKNVSALSSSSFTSFKGHGYQLVPPNKNGFVVLCE